MIGSVYGRYTVIAKADRSRYAVCRCSCGTEKEVALSTLRLGKSSSCGCLRREVLRRLRMTHGQAGMHGTCANKTKEYRAWTAMKNRCYNDQSPDYSDYGGRGITVHPDWIDSFESFFAYVGEAPSPEHSIDRIRVNGDYEPGNVRWATKQQQALNKRNAVKFLYKGRRWTIRQLELHSGIKESTIRARVKAGWTLANALTKPLREGGRWQSN